MKDRQGASGSLQPKYAIAVRSGLTCGIILMLCELGFSTVIYFLRPSLAGYLSSGDLSSVTPLVFGWLAFLFLILAICFACGMLVAKGLAAFPVRNGEIAALGAMAGALAEVLRSVVAVATNFAISLLLPVADTSALGAALDNAGFRLLCGLPLFVLLAAAVAGISAYAFSLIFFRPENTPG